MNYRIVTLPLHNRYNGSGKTTLLRTIAQKMPLLTGQIEQGPSVKLGYMTQEQTGLDPALSPYETIQHAFGSDFH